MLLLFAFAMRSAIALEIFVSRERGTLGKVDTTDEK
jgi:hypothetical protein